MRIPRSMIQFVLSCLLVLMMDSFTLLAEDPGIAVSVETGVTRYRIGDPIEFMIHADVPDGTRVIFPGDTLDLHPFLIRDRQLRPPVQHEGQTRETMVLELSIYDVGEFEIPEIDVKWESTDGSSGSAKTEAHFIRIDSVLKQGEQEPRKVKPPLNAPVRNRFIFGVFAGVLLFLGLIFLMILFIRKMLRQKTVDSEKASEPVRPPDIVAMESLAALRESNLLAQGQIKDYFITLTEILKTYIGRRFEFNAPERTTGEIRADMKSLRMELNIQTDVLHVLDLADMVKFARYLPPDGHCRDALAEVETIVNQTRDRFRELHSNPGAVPDRVPL